MKVLRLVCFFIAVAVQPTHANEHEGSSVKTKEEVESEIDATIRSIVRSLTVKVSALDAYWVLGFRDEC
jgi:hypothetical protein